MNTIRRPRKRPREKSSNFRTFWWVLAREAFLRITEIAHPNGFTELHRRQALCDRPTSWVVAVGRSFIRSNPGRRFRP